MKIVTIVGARPQFIKAAAFSRAAIDGKRATEILIHTGQHYDHGMSQVFFDELDIPPPNYNLGVGGGTHGQNTGRMIEKIEEVLMTEKPGCVLVYGDTDSTLAGALAAAKLHIPVAHVEAGLRSYNRRMPEEINRVLTDHLSSLLFCPTETAVKNLMKEGITSGVFNVGDVMYDASLHYRDIALSGSRVLDQFALTEKGYALATIHRAENTDDPQRLKSIASALSRVAEDIKVILPIHPRLRKAVEPMGGTSVFGKTIVSAPLPYLDMVRLEISAAAIFTDSGGVQKEAFFYGAPCITLRDETEWVETLESGFNRLCGASADKILDAWVNLPKDLTPPSVSPYGDGKAAERIFEIITGTFPML